MRGISRLHSVASPFSEPFALPLSSDLAPLTPQRAWFLLLFRSPPAPVHVSYPHDLHKEYPGIAPRDAGAFGLNDRRPYGTICSLQSLVGAHDWRKAVLV